MEDHLEAALAWFLAGVLFCLWSFVKLGGLDYNPEAIEMLAPESHDSSR